MTGPHYISPGLRAVMARREEMHEEKMDTTSPMMLEGHVRWHHAKDSDETRKTQAISRHRAIAAEIAKLRAEGLTWNQVAEKMGVSPLTAQRHQKIAETGDLTWAR